MSNRSTVLIVDDEMRSLEAVERTIDDEFNVRTASGAAEAERILAEDWVQVVISDQRMPGINGIEFLKGVRERWPEVIRMIISGYTDPGDIIEGINEAGIYQYITKPWHPDQLLLAVRNAARLYQLQHEYDLLAVEAKVVAPVLERQLTQRREQLKRVFHMDEIVRAEGSPLDEICDLTLRIASYDIVVLVTGESGTGKELFARALHYNSLRADKPFVVENCGALPDPLLESELFGHKRGAFTGAICDRVGLFEQADGGTVFLDEIGEISPAFQVKLLRVLQGGEFRPLGSNQRRKANVRVVAATNRNLAEEVRAGRFREDLYYRLSVMHLHLPPLRARSMDIPLLAKRALEWAVKLHGKPIKGFTDEAIAYMQAYVWPGNVRELENEVQRMLVLADGDSLGKELLSAPICASGLRGGGILCSSPLAGGSLKERVERMEAHILQEVLIRHGWNKSRAAAELGLSRVGLRSKVERYGLGRKLDS